MSDGGSGSAAPSETGTLATALQLTARLLASDPKRAELQAREILRTVPRHPQASLFLGSSLRQQGKISDALEVLRSLAASQSNSTQVQYELGVTLNEAGDTRAAMGALRLATALSPNSPLAWLALADCLRLSGDTAAADSTYARHIQASVNEPRLMEAAAALCENRVAISERILRPYLKEHPTDVAAIRMLAETGVRLGRYEDAGKLLQRCVELAPGFTPARYNYATVLYRLNRPADAIAQLRILLSGEPRNPSYRNLLAAAHARLGEHDEAIMQYQAFLQEYPNQPKGWMSYGHTLKAVGRHDDSIAAYRKSIEQAPNLGESYWSLANLKTFRFTTAEAEAMMLQIVRSDISPEDRFHLHFALGKAFEDQGDYARSFQHYEQGNLLRREGIDYDPMELQDQNERSKVVFTSEFFNARKDQGAPSSAPIFVVGLPRSGSTLIEQILASHSQVEGTMELPDIPSIVARLEGKKRKGEPVVYPNVLETLGAEQLNVLGEEYLERTKVHRRLGRAHFVDKMPNNFAHIGLIHLILPNAKIIDARRHPLACCFSGFKQHFARGQAFSYDLTDLGRYYADYVSLMAHYDAVLPGRMHRVIYEELVESPEIQIRRLLDYCGLPFEDSCLHFHETERAVRTASSEQVRKPLYREGLDQWRNFEPWLGPLKEALGPVLTDFPAFPAA